MSKKRIIYVPDRCPYCDSDDLVCKKEYFSGNYLNIPIVCKKCGKASKEVYYIEYCETEGYY
jgi:predicted Zn-ribbon and HTH transcriptional regulator